MEWAHHANCDSGGEAGCYKLAGKKLGIRLKIGAPSSHGMSYMRGVYTEPLSRERDSELSSEYFNQKQEMNNSPDKAKWDGGTFGFMPSWMKWAWVACAAGWVLVILAR